MPTSTYRPSSPTTVRTFARARLYVVHQPGLRHNPSRDRDVGCLLASRRNYGDAFSSLPVWRSHATDRLL